MKKSNTQQRHKYFIILTVFSFVILCNVVSFAEYVDMGNGVVLDKSRSLLWQQSDDGEIRNYYAALQYCKDLNVAGSDSWVLPSKWALSTLVDPNFSPTISPVFSANPSDYLTSDYHTGLCMNNGYNGKGSSGYSYIYAINFNDGRVSVQSTDSVCGMEAVAGYTRCVSDYKPPNPSLSPIINFLLSSSSRSKSNIKSNNH